MAQSTNNTVKFGVNTKPTFPNPSFKTQTSTPQRGGLGGNFGIATPSLTAITGQPAQIKPSGATRPTNMTGGTQSTTGALTNTTAVNSNPYDSIRSQAGVIQTGIDNLRSSQQTTNTQTNNNQNTSETSFKGILDKILGASGPTSEQERARREMERIARGNQSIMDNARATSEKYGQEIARIGDLGAGAVAGNLSTGTNVVGSGNAAIASQSASQRMNALAQGLDAELKGSAQQLTGQEQMASAFRPSLDATLTQQQLGLSGLGTAGNLASPVVAPYGQTVFNPLTPGFAGGNMDPQTQASTIAQQLMSGQLTYDQAIEAMQYAGTAGTNFLNQALSSMGANPLQLQAQGTAQQTNLQTTGTATTGIARAGLEETTRNYNQLIGAADAAHRQAQNVNTILDKTGLNNISSTDYNKALNNLQRRFSDTDFAALQTALNEAQIMYTNLLSTGGGTPTGNENNAITALNINQSAAAIKSSIQQLENAASNRLQAQQGIMQQYQQNLNSGSGMTGTSGGGQSYTSPSGRSYQLPY